MPHPDRHAFERAIHQHWAHYFGCPVAVTGQPGTTLRPEDQFAGDNAIHLWYIGAHTFVQLDPQCVPLVTQLLATLPPQTALKATTLQQAWGAAAVKFHDQGLVHYLYPPELPAYAPAAPARLRQLTPADSAQMAALHAACTPAEVDEGFVEVTHQIAFGGFVGEQLVAAASGYERTGFMDIGVLTHPGFRRQGLGKAVVGALCAWAAPQNYIAQYRCDAQNTSSASVAQALNFRLYFHQESVGLV